jgi:hypothetical protein
VVIGNISYFQSENFIDSGDSIIKHYRKNMNFHITGECILSLKEGKYKIPSLYIEFD